MYWCLLKGYHDLQKEDFVDFSNLEYLIYNVKEKIYIIYLVTLIKKIQSSSFNVIVIDDGDFQSILNKFKKVDLIYC